MASELKPCPFCGSNQLSFRSTPDMDTDGKFHRISCNECGAGSREKFAMETCPLFYEELRNAWNTRPAPAATDTELETVAYVWKTKDAPWRFEEPFFRSVDQWRASDEHYDHADLCLRSQAVDLLAAERAEKEEARRAEEEAKDCFWSIYETYLEKGGLPVSTEGARSALSNRIASLEADNAALTARVKELEGINANLMGDDEDKPRYTTKRLKHEIARATEALEAKLAAAEKDAATWEANFKALNAKTARAVLGGKPS